MELHKLTACLLILVAVTVSLTRADYHFENYKVYNYDGDSEPYRKPWFIDEYSSPFSQQNHAASSVQAVHDNPGPEVYENPAEAYFVASTKRVPNEDKNFKKAISPFYTLTDSDNEKYKSIVLKSGAPYCQEIKSAVPKKRYRRDAMTCYKCKDPKNGATYEQCSYTSQPQETSQVTEYVPLPQSFRYRRSNANANDDKGNNGKEKSSEFLKPHFRFSEEYFTPAASDQVPSEFKKKMENCEKVVKDSMVCMVCKDPKTNEKYEQCSYTNQPKDKAYAYSKSSSFGLPEDSKKHAEETRAPVKQTKRAYGSEDAEKLPQTEFEGSHPEVDKYFEEQTAAIKARTPKSKTYGEPEGSDELESGSENVKDGTCKKIVKDTMVCTVCKDAKTGGNYEQCAYAYNPSDKVYQFTRQKTFGYPDEEDTKKSSGYGESADYYKPEGNSGNGERSDEHHNPNTESEKYSYYQPSEKQESQEYLPYKSESEKVSDEIKEGQDCKKVEKDSMTCMVCKDPKTGGNYEQCSYAYEPNDKVYSYSKAKSFGSPEADQTKEGYGAEGEGNPEGSYGLTSDTKPYVTVSKDHASPEVGDFLSTSEKKKEIEKVFSQFQQEDRSKCKKVIKDKLTCFQCTDKDGVQKEECIFVADQKPQQNKLSYREVKQFQREPITAATDADRNAKNYYPRIRDFEEEMSKPVKAVSKKQKRKTKKVAATPESHSYSEPLISSASEHEEQTRNTEDDSRARQESEEAESEPYDYAAATKPTYDKVLGITLPRYMLQTSEHEIEFDEVVASSKI